MPACRFISAFALHMSALVPSCPHRDNDAQAHTAHKLLHGSVVHMSPSLMTLCAACSATAHAKSLVQLHLLPLPIAHPILPQAQHPSPALLLLKVSLESGSVVPAHSCATHTWHSVSWKQCWQACKQPSSHIHFYGHKSSELPISRSK